MKSLLSTSSRHPLCVFAHSPAHLQFTHQCERGQANRTNCKHSSNYKLDHLRLSCLWSD